MIRKQTRRRFRSRQIVAVAVDEPEPSMDEMGFGWKVGRVSDGAPVPRCEF